MILEDPKYLNERLKQYIHKHLAGNLSKFELDRINLKAFSHRAINKFGKDPERVQEFVGKKVQEINDKAKKIDEHMKLEPEELFKQYGIDPVKKHRQYDIVRQMVPRKLEQHFGRASGVK